MWDAPAALYTSGIRDPLSGVIAVFRPKPSFAYRAADNGELATGEFQKILDHPGVIVNFP
ncbi:MAG: hypothetical protein DMG68_10135 [Acidobacteria bacterium]|nr:MAG: hypothetical protein DMG68_10135 [Acidobacteriota bacterium]